MDNKNEGIKKIIEGMDAAGYLVAGITPELAGGQYGGYVDTGVLSVRIAPLVKKPSAAR